MSEDSLHSSLQQFLSLLLPSSNRMDLLTLVHIVSDTLLDHFRALKPPPPEHFRALKMTLLEHFRTLKITPLFENFRALKCSNRAVAKLERLESPLKCP